MQRGLLVALGGWGLQDISFQINGNTIERSGKMFAYLQWFPW